MNSFQLFSRLRVFLETLFQDIGMNLLCSQRFTQLTLIVLLFLVCLLCVLLLRRMAIPRILHLVKNTPTEWDDYLINRPVLKALFHIVPSVLVYNLLPLCFSFLLRFRSCFLRLRRERLLKFRLQLIYARLSKFGLLNLRRIRVDAGIFPELLRQLLKFVLLLVLELTNGVAVGI